MTCEPTALIGRWTLRRRVRERATGLVGTVEGQLEIAAAADHLTWTETGRFTWTQPRSDGAGREPARSAEVSRMLRLADVDGGWWMQFADGSPFHPWNADRIVEHPCRDDLYVGLVSVSPDARAMRTLWDVTGPTKDQRLVTRLRR